MPPSPDHGQINAYPSTGVILRDSGHDVCVQRVAAIHKLFLADFTQRLNLVPKQRCLLILL